MNGSTSRDRSPLRHPAAANVGFTTSPSLHPPFSTSQQGSAATVDSSFDQALFDQALAQQLNDPTFSAFATNNTTTTDFDPSFTDISNQNHLSPHSLSSNTSPTPQHDSFNFPTFDFNTDSTLITDLDLLQQAGQQGDLNGGKNILSTMSAVTHSPTPPHLLARASNSPSPHASPAGQHSPFTSLGSRPRNTSESLDPSSAAFPARSSGDWTTAGAFRGHRRVHSDNLSDISSHSNHASPYLSTLESFESASHASPLLNATQDPILGDALGIGSFNLNDQTVQHSFRSPGHSPHISPHLVPQPQQPLPAFTSADNYGMNVDITTQMFPAIGIEMGQSDQMSPPEINIDYAPNQRPLNAPPLHTIADNDNSLTLPLKTSRTRAKSASFVDSRPTTPSVAGRGRSPSLHSGGVGDGLSPFGRAASNPSSRDTSPRGRASSLSNRVRSTSATSDQREYILDLANPERSPSNGGDNRRAQKHPATFQCHLCPKRFTRAYNLRSHLRTHTDERPFVCTVCRKAFARQHDRKRHEGLHSGEKKFICRGPLKNGELWGCTRRFARADALGRHFRSEAGRVCIRPLLEEEAAEQQQANDAAWIDQQSGMFTHQPQQRQQQLGVDYHGSNFLPARILEQYPALAGIDWASAAAQGGADDDNYGGRSSFDASSGGEMYDDLSEGDYVDPSAEMGMGYPAGMATQGFGLQGQKEFNQQDQQQPVMVEFGSHRMGDYTNGFEGR